MTLTKGFQSKSLHFKTEGMKLYRPYFIRNGRKEGMDRCISMEEAEKINSSVLHYPTGVDIIEDDVVIIYVLFHFYKDDFTSDFGGISFNFPEGEWQCINPGYWKDSQGNHVERFIMSLPKSQSLTRRGEIEKQLDEMYLHELPVMEEISNVQE